jgi:uncharacterized phiE125 gp8 family phage protein
VVTWYAGYSATGTSVPAPVKAAILLLVAHLWKNREASAEVTLTEIPFGVKTMLSTIGWGSYK